MKAWQVESLGSPSEVIALVDKPVPQPGPGEVQLRVSATGVGLPDVLMCHGKYAFKPELPFTPGQEVAGLVTAVGEGCSLQVGQPVMGITSFLAGHGGFAEYCLASENTLYPVDENMPAVEAAAFCIPYHTAIAGLKLRANMQPGEVLLIHGAAGGSGYTAIQLGKAMGATVITTAGSESKLEFCRAQGADYAFNYREQDFAAEVMDITGGRGVDVVYDPVGGEIFEQSVACTASGGRLLAIGFASGRWGIPETRQLVMRNCSVMGVFVGAYSQAEMLPCHRELLELYSEGKISLRLDAAIPMQELADYLGQLERREVQGKVVVDMGESFSELS